MKNLSKKIAIASIVLAVGARIVLNVPYTFATKPNTDDNHKVTICHRTNSVTNPYTMPTVDAASVDGDSSNDNGQGDHLLEHLGPVFDVNNPPPPPHNGDQWGDIIPPFYDDGTPDGLPSLNWTAAGQAYFYNGCNIPGVTPTITPTVTPTATPTNTPTPTPTGCQRDCGGNNPTPTPTNTPTPTITPTPTTGGGNNPTPTLTDTPTPTPYDPGNQGGPGDGLSDGRSDGRSDGGSSGSQGSVLGASTAAAQGEVLGASTMAKTGTFESNLATIEGIVGAALAAIGIKLNGKAKNKKSK